MRGRDAERRGKGPLWPRRSVLVALVLSGIPALLVKLGLDQILDGLTSNAAPDGVHSGTTFVALGFFLAAFAIFFAVFGVRDEIVTRLQAHSERSTGS